jgi:hypothetical protein
MRHGILIFRRPEELTNPVLVVIEEKTDRLDDRRFARSARADDARQVW